MSDLKLKELYENIITISEALNNSGSKPEWIIDYKDIIVPNVWICPKCGGKQSDNLNWCGKNLTCNYCNETSYYKEWVIE